MQVSQKIEFNSIQTQAAPRLEQAFLEEMLKYIAPDSGGGGFSGGSAEGQFRSFLHQEYAAALSQRLDLGLRVQA